ncbi:Cell division and transport-associated protein TolA [Cribrihabitans marinus]|uniref:Cell division and transport-associated protein TolA n=1 Tax=Cribrihabitans marinus TaxID=1227549 RepID=A0A1H7APE8_9RHOB|nr:energy transducer TonB [Cribrihabitans marinus]GGH31916.1 hypothetical protein GCM10010973_23020 [Cribrihabitans marinus]SEJ65707.1 Cell division and transport-associated protein TolA [Cribrihabitans marinus]
MQTGTKISAIAHATLIGWAVFGGTFRSEPLPFEVQDVSIISSEEFAALSAPREAPEVVTRPEEPTEPEAQPQDVVVPEPDTPEPEAPQPEPVPAPAPDPVPEAVPETPEPEVPDDTPTLVQPEPEVAVPAPPADERPKPRPVDRVAPVPVARPDPDTRPDEVESPAVTEDDGAETPQEPSEATAPEEATDQIVTEATETDEAAPLRSPRPPARRPSPPEVAEAPVETPTGTPTEETPRSDTPPATEDAVQDALAEALGGESTAPAPTGPPLTGGEKEGLRVAVSRCWNVGSLSTDALGTTVVVGVDMNQDGTPVVSSIRMLDSQNGSDSAARQAFEAARRAIIRCGASGYDLPVEKYGQWQTIEMTFNPERMRIK